MKTLSEALGYNNITHRPINIVDVAGYYNLKKPFTLSALMKILLKKVLHSAGSTIKLYQLTGEWDRERNQPTTSRTEMDCHLVGTDLGSSFEHMGCAYFLFGDANVFGGGFGGRCIAFMDVEDPEHSGYEWGPPLRFVLDDNDNTRRYFIPYIQPPPDISLDRGFNVMTGGFSANGKMYVFCTTNHFSCANPPDPATQSWCTLHHIPDPAEVMGKSVLTWSDQFNCNILGTGHGPFHYLYDMSDVRQGGKFINKSAVIVNNDDIPGLPNTAVPGAKGLLLWGTGIYHRSNPYLAYTVDRC